MAYTIEAALGGTAFTLDGTNIYIRSTDYYLSVVGDTLGIKRTGDKQNLAVEEHFSSWNGGSFTDIEDAKTKVGALIFSVGYRSPLEIVPIGTILPRVSRHAGPVTLTFLANTISLLQLITETGTSILTIGSELPITFDPATSIAGITLEGKVTEAITIDIPVSSSVLILKHIL